MVIVSFSLSSNKDFSVLKEIGMLSDGQRVLL